MSDRKLGGLRRSSWCLDCEHADSRARTRRHVEVLGKPWTIKRNQLRYAARRRWHVDPDDLVDYVETHPDRCDICGRSAIDAHPDGRGLHVDHVHGEGGVRGMLCAHCNTGLGHFQESPELLLRAAAYLMRGPVLPSTLLSPQAA